MPHDDGAAPDPAAAAPGVEPALAAEPAPGVGPSPEGEPSEHSPAQQEVLAVLGAPRHERPTFDPRLRTHLREELEERLAPLAATLDVDDPLFVTKHRLNGVHGCQVSFLHREREPFAWAVPVARGIVAHKAIELSVNWPGPAAPGVLVDAALTRLVDGGGTGGIGDWLSGLPAAEWAELRGEAADRVTKFVECFPPLLARWSPVTESRLRAELCGGTVVLSGKVDLTVGRAEQLLAGKVVVDLKTGGFTPSHREDLRFYALVETLRIGVPPRLVASYYLDSGTIHEEAVTEDLLRGALRRVADGAEMLLALRGGEAEPVLRAGPACQWCPVPNCESGQHWLEQRRERDGW